MTVKSTNCQGVTNVPFKYDCFYQPLQVEIKAIVVEVFLAN